MRTLFVCSILVVCGLIGSCGLEKLISVRHNVADKNARSMMPTINPGDHFASVGIGVKDNQIDPMKRFDIVLYRVPPGSPRRFDEKTLLFSRIVGLGGETIEIKMGVVFIDGVQLDESSFGKYPSADNFKSLKIPANEFFVLGDSRGDSWDSRYFGGVRLEDIDGKVNNIVSKEDYDNGKRW